MLVWSVAAGAVASRTYSSQSWSVVRRHTMPRHSPTLRTSSTSPKSGGVAHGVSVRARVHHDAGMLWRFPATKESRYAQRCWPLRRSIASVTGRPAASDGVLIADRFHSCQRSCTRDSHSPPFRICDGFGQSCASVGVLLSRWVGGGRSDTATRATQSGMGHAV